MMLRRRSRPSNASVSRAPAVAVRARALNTWAATRRTRLARTAVICGGGRSSTPFPSAWTSESIADRGSAGGRPTGFDKSIYKRRNEVERTFNALECFRAAATRFDKRAYVFHGTVTVASLRLWLRA